VAGAVGAELLARFLYAAEERVVSDVTKWLRESPVEHYRQMETIDLKPRMQALYEAYRESVLAGTPDLVHAFTADVGRKRLQQGYRLEELLFVVDTLAAAVWNAASDAFRPRGADAFDDLRRLALGIYWSKDRLATVYAEEAKEDLVALRRLSAAFHEYLRLRRTSTKDGPGAAAEGRPGDEV